MWGFCYVLCGGSYLKICIFNSHAVLIIKCLGMKFDMHIFVVQPSPRRSPDRRHSSIVDLISDIWILIITCLCLRGARTPVYRYDVQLQRMIDGKCHPVSGLNENISWSGMMTQSFLPHLRAIKFERKRRPHRYRTLHWRKAITCLRTIQTKREVPPWCAFTPSSRP